MPAAAHYASEPVNQKTEEHEAVARSSERLELSVEDRWVFFESILNPPAPSELLKAAARRYFRYSQR
jgi:uncharacterized protein (DUF1778 family)